MSIGIGSPVWVFDSNRRIYPRPPPGGRYISSAPIWREHWAKREITGETARSWLVGPRLKIPKRGASPYRFAFSQEDIDGQEYVHDHRYMVARAVEVCFDPVKLRKIAEIVGYQHDKPR